MRRCLQLDGLLREEARIQEAARDVSAFTSMTSDIPMAILPCPRCPPPRSIVCKVGSDCNHITCTVCNPSTKYCGICGWIKTDDSFGWLHRCVDDNESCMYRSNNARNLIRQAYQKLLDGSK